MDNLPPPQVGLVTSRELTKKGIGNNRVEESTESVACSTTTSSEMGTNGLSNNSGGDGCSGNGKCQDGIDTTDTMGGCSRGDKNGLCVMINNGDCSSSDDQSADDDDSQFVKNETMKNGEDNGGNKPSLKSDKGSCGGGDYWRVGDNTDGAIVLRDGGRPSRFLAEISKFQNNGKRSNGGSFSGYGGGHGSETTSNGSEAKKAKVDEGTGEVDGDDHDHYADWLSLPEEIWSYILSYTTNFEKTKTRLVCKTLRHIVDSHSLHSVKINGKMGPDRLHMVCGLRSQYVEVSSLYGPDTDLSFHYPGCVKELVVTTHVTPENFFKLCHTFTETQVLRFLGTFMSMKTFTNETRKDCVRALGSLRKLREIEVALHNFGVRSAWSCIAFNTVFCSNIDDLPFRTLSAVTVNLALHHEEMLQFFSFLVARSDTIRHVTTRVSCIAGQPQQSHSAEVFQKYSTPEALREGLKKLRLFSLHVYSAPQCQLCELTQIWNEVLLNQTTLVNLTMDHHDLVAPDVITIITNNKYLRSCKLYQVSWTSVRGLEEIIMVDTCNYLEELLLDFQHTFVILCVGKDTPAERCTLKFFELDNLPQSLRKLSLKGYQFPRNQILSALIHMSHVEEVNLHDCIFRDEPNKLKLLYDIFMILASAECGIRRFIFSAPSDLAQESSAWNRVMAEASQCGVIKPPSPGVMHENEYYDFSFTKDALQEFVDRCAIVLSTNCNGSNGMERRSNHRN